jgi:hypothetical protein
MASQVGVGKILILWALAGFVMDLWILVGMIDPANPAQPGCPVSPVSSVDATKSIILAFLNTIVL